MSPLWETTTNEIIREAVGPAVPLLERLTHLGDGVVLGTIAVVLYLTADHRARRERMFVIAIGAAAFALSTGLKGLVVLPRPDLAFTPTGYSGYAFPSAHAMGAAAVYGAVAATVRVGPRWARYLAAGGLVILISLSRVVMGVHYLGDVLVGAILGGLLVWIGLGWQRYGTLRPFPVLVLAIAIALVTIGLGAREYPTFVTGVTIGSALGWLVVMDRRTTSDDVAILITAGLAILALMILGAVAMVLNELRPSVGLGPVRTFGEVIAFGTVTALVIVLPTLATSLEEHEIVARVRRSVDDLSKIVRG